MDKVSERISVLDIFKIGIGPSSSHTMGPWKAALVFTEALDLNGLIENIQNIKVKLFGSLAKTGKGHGTGMAIVLGLSGYDPRTVNLDLVNQTIKNLRSVRSIQLMGKFEIPFNYEEDIIFLKDQQLPFHPNCISFEAHTLDGQKIGNTFYSTGGGFIVNEDISGPESSIYDFPYPIDSAGELLNWTRTSGCRIADIVKKNELSLRSEAELKSALFEIWGTMANCIFRGCHSEGVLPGGLNVKRRASSINRHLLPDDHTTNYRNWMEQIGSGTYSFNEILKWVSCFAIAVNEENASYGRVVTAPTNGAAGVIPAVLMYYLCFTEDPDELHILDFLLVAGEMGSIFKKGSTISAAMGGCQAEIGVSSAMAAAALTECLGGQPEHAVMAAEIAMEHHLGLTCDPVGGLVQVPCIERNSMGAVKAITAAYLALESDPDAAKVSLDGVIKTMWDTALDMNSKYKETSDGGLAVNIPVNLTDC